ncbi:Transcriptional regulatory protein ZraR [invertebrate metagenome]|uniref:Transcriptional regulatory protein ZraR n=1 Tax=invertebrate metagenome TaxID=1711999 RepID=A0A2H9TC25_9ZZZZ
MYQKPILIIEDEEVIRQSLSRLLKRNGYRVCEASSVREACNCFCLEELSLVISDLRLPGQPGTDMIKHVPSVPVLIMTSYASLTSAVETMKQGAVDYIAKPFDHNDMLKRIDNILKKKPQNVCSSDSQRVDLREKSTEPKIGQKNRKNIRKKSVEKISDKQDEFGSMLGQCKAMQQLFQYVKKVSPTDASVLILGETGTGKELVATAIHKNSKRSDHTMISVNCAAIPETLIESELFGHEKGAFTGAVASRAGLIEAADGGTLFLDEIGELPLEAQARLLRVLQEGEIRRVGAVYSKKVDVRLIAATHRNLAQLAIQRRFRQDLYYRLKVVELRVPPLRERGNDIMMLAKYLLKKYGKKMGKHPMVFSPEAAQVINSYTWPGNVRELEHAVERAIILSDHHCISVDELDIRSPDNNDNKQSSPIISSTENTTLEYYFQQFVLEHQDYMTETDLAQKLGISRKTLWERRQRLGIPRRKTLTTG